jgi:PAS domain S-box-containing protein
MDERVAQVDGQPPMPRPADSPSTRELLDALLEQGREFSLVFMNSEGVITDWLGRSCDIFGFSSEEMVGKSALHIFTPEDIAEGSAKHEFEVGRVVGRSDDDRWQMRKDGARFWASGVLTSLRRADGKFLGYAKLLRDRTDLKTQTEVLENRVKSLTETQARIRTFLGTIAHELRGPLAPLRMAATIVRDSKQAGGDVEVPLRVIDQQIDALIRVVDDLVDVTLLETGKAQVRLEPLDVKDVVSAAAEAARPLVKERALHLSPLLVEGPVVVNGDKVRLQQVIGNLLGNAIKFTPPDGNIWLQVTTEGGDAVIRVQDTGVGMDAEILPRVFDVFTQAESSREIAPGGLGLGLAVARDLVKLHGGTVQARSEGRNRGSVFTVRLPLHEATQP